jgi:hypothetical protein
MAALPRSAGPREFVTNGPYQGISTAYSHKRTGARLSDSRGSRPPAHLLSEAGANSEAGKSLD